MAGIPRPRVTPTVASHLASTYVAQDGEMLIIKETGELFIGDGTRLPRNLPSRKEALRKTVSILEPRFGGKGIGTADATADAAALTGIAQYMRDTGGGTVILPSTLADGVTPAVWNLGSSGADVTSSNVTWVCGGSFVKPAGSTYYAGLIYSSKWADTTRFPMRRGYGSGGENNRWITPYFKGSYDPAALSTMCAFSLHHVRGFYVDNPTFDECQGDGHSGMDACGCWDVIVRGVRSLGYRNGSGLPTDEQFQPDTSTNGSLSHSWYEPAGCYDGLATGRMHVEGEWLPKTVRYPTLNSGAATVFPCANPMGSHSLREGSVYTDIRLQAKMVDPAEGTGTGYTRGNLHFVNTDGLKIDLIAESTNGHGGRLINIVGTDQGQNLTDDPNNNILPHTTGMAFVCSNVEINARLKGFVAPEGGTVKSSTVNVIGLLGPQVGMVAGAKINLDIRDGWRSAATPGDYGLYLNGVRNSSATVRASNMAGVVSVHHFTDLVLDVDHTDCGKSSVYPVSINTGDNDSATDVISRGLRYAIRSLRQQFPHYMRVFGADGLIKARDIRTAAGDGVLNIAGGADHQLSADSYVEAIDGTTRPKAVAVYNSTARTKIGAFATRGITTRVEVDTTSADTVVQQIPGGPVTYTASVTLAGADFDAAAILMNNSAAATVTIPAHAGTNKVAIGTSRPIVRYGAGTVAFAAASGVTLRMRATLTMISGQYGTVTLTKIGLNEWLLAGDLS